MKTCPIVQTDCEHGNCTFWLPETEECLIIRYLRYNSELYVKKGV